MFKFKNADPTRRMPVWLQNGTKENVVWQLKLTGLMIAGFWIYDLYEQHKYRKEFKKNKQHRDALSK